MNPKPAFLHALLPCSQVKNQDFLDCVPKTISWREPDWLDVKSKVSLESNPHSYLGKKLSNSSKMLSEWEGKKIRKTKKDREGTLLLNIFPSTQAQTWNQSHRKKGTDKALGERGQKLPSISKNWCSISAASHQHSLSSEANAPSVPRGGQDTAI